MLLIGSLVVGISRRDHHALNTSYHQLVEVRTNTVRIGAIEQRSIRRHAETGSHSNPHALHRNVVTTLAAHREIMMLTLPIHMHLERKILARLEQVQLLLQQKSVRAHVDILLPRHQSGNDLRHLWMQQRLAARNRNHRRSALFYSLEAIFR